MRGVKDQRKTLLTEVGIAGHGLTLCNSENWLLLATTFSEKKKAKTSDEKFVSGGRGENNIACVCVCDAINCVIVECGFGICDAGSGGGLEWLWGC